MSSEMYWKEWEKSVSRLTMHMMSLSELCKFILAMRGSHTAVLCCNLIGLKIPTKCILRNKNALKVVLFTQC